MIEDPAPPDLQTGALRALDDAVDAWYVLDPEWRIVYANRRAETLWGRDRNAVLGRGVWAVFPEAVGSEVYHAHQRAAAEQRTVPVRVVSPVLHRPIEGEICPGPAGLIVRFRECGEERPTIAQVVASLAHDLRAPLAVIRGNAQFLRHRLQGGAPGASLEPLIDRIEESTDRMASEIDTVFDLALLESGQPLPLRRHPTDMVALVHRLAEQCRDQHPRHRPRVQAAVSVLLVDVDTDRIQRVIANLLDNAAKYSPRVGEILVTVARREADDGAWATVSVQDHGIGIPAADLPRVFDRYVRGANVGAIPGDGLGLAGCHQIAEQHGGRLELASAVGEGTTITLVLPINEQAGPSARPVNQPAGAAP